MIEEFLKLSSMEDKNNLWNTNTVKKKFGGIQNICAWKWEHVQLLSPVLDPAMGLFHLVAGSTSPVDSVLRLNEQENN